MKSKENTIKKLIIVLVVLVMTFANAEDDSKSKGLNLSFTSNSEIGLGYFAWNALQLEIFINGYRFSDGTQSMFTYRARALYYNDLKDEISIYYGIGIGTTYISISVGSSSINYTPTIGLEYSLNQSFSINGDFGLSINDKGQGVSTGLMLKYFF